MNPVEGLTFEQARDELQGIVGQLEQGDVALQQAMDLWQRGQALAQHCEQLLSDAQARLAAAQPDSD